MDKSYTQLLKYANNIPYKPDIQDLRTKNGTYHQYADTFNLLGIQPNREKLQYVNLIIPVLHIQLGILNKIVTVLDLVVTEWERKQNWVSQGNSPGFLRIYRALWKVHVRREVYFSGEIAGQSGHAL